MGIENQNGIPNEKIMELDSGNQSPLEKVIGLEKSTGDGKKRLDKTDDSLPSKINNIQKDNAQSLTDHRNDVDDKLAKHKRNLQVEHESIGSEIQILNQYSEEVKSLQITTKPLFSR